MLYLLQAELDYPPEYIGCTWNKILNAKITLQDRRHLEFLYPICQPSLDGSDSWLSVLVTELSPKCPEISEFS